MSQKKVLLLMSVVAIVAPWVLAGTVPAGAEGFADIADSWVDFFTSTVVKWGASIAGIAAALGLGFALRQGGLGQGGSKILNWALGTILAGSVTALIVGFGVEGGMVP